MRTSQSISGSPYRYIPERETLKGQSVQRNSLREKKKTPLRQASRAPFKRGMFQAYMKEKLAVMGIIIMLALFALIYKIYGIIDENAISYSQAVLTQQKYDSRPIPYRRGDILDRNGTCLATSEKVYNLIIDPKQIMSDKENYLEPTLSALQEIMGYDADSLRTMIAENSTVSYIRYKNGRRLSYEQMEKFQSYAKAVNDANDKSSDASIKKKRIMGVWFEEEYRRIYPNNSLACNVIGFAAGDGQNGQGGIEQYYNEQLIGTNGREYGYLDDDSNLERVIKGAVNGNTIVSTIDINIQAALEKYIRKWQEEIGSDRVAALAMDPNSGEVLGMSSDKIYDLNNPRTSEDDYPAEEIRELGLGEAVIYYKSHPVEGGPESITREQAAEYYSDEEIRQFGLQVKWNQEWRNFCVSDTFEPGSPSKIFTVAAALEEGIITGNEHFTCDGFQEVGGYKIKCVNRYGHGELSVQESLMESCNDIMMQIAAMTGRSNFTHHMKLFGFGQSTGIDLPGEESAKSLVYDEETMKPVDLATNSFGQGYNCTMVQMAAAYCSVINGGSYYEPHVAKRIVNSQGTVIKEIKPRLARETVSESTSNFIKEALFRTVEEGTGKAAAVEGYRIAGKTGTAQKIPRDSGDYLVSFCGYAPADDPQVLVYVIIDTPHVEDQPHSSYASGIFSEIMAEILPYLNIYPEGETAEENDAAASMLSIEEGITGQPMPDLEDDAESLEASEDPAKETRVYATDEYIDEELREAGGILGDDPDENSSDGDFSDEDSSSEEGENEEE